MTPTPWTPEDVEAVARALHASIDKPCTFPDDWLPQATAALRVLAERGRLVGTDNLGARYRPEQDTGNGGVARSLEAAVSGPVSPQQPQAPAVVTEAMTNAFIHAFTERHEDWNQGSPVTVRFALSAALRSQSSGDSLAQGEG